MPGTPPQAPPPQVSSPHFGGFRLEASNHQRSSHTPRPLRGPARRQHAKSPTQNYIGIDFDDSKGLASLDGDSGAPAIGRYSPKSARDVVPPQNAFGRGSPERRRVIPMSQGYYSQNAHGGPQQDGPVDIVVNSTAAASAGGGALDDPTAAKQVIMQSVLAAMNDPRPSIVQRIAIKPKHRGSAGLARSPEQLAAEGTDLLRKITSRSGRTLSNLSPREFRFAQDPGSPKESLPPAAVTISPEGKVSVPLSLQSPKSSASVASGDNAPPHQLLVESLSARQRPQWSPPGSPLAGGMSPKAAGRAIEGKTLSLSAEQRRPTTARGTRPAAARLLPARPRSARPTLRLPKTDTKKGSGPIQGVLIVSARAPPTSARSPLRPRRINLGSSKRTNARWAELRPRIQPKRASTGQRHKKGMTGPLLHNPNVGPRTQQILTSTSPHSRRPAAVALLKEPPAPARKRKESMQTDRSTSPRGDAASRKESSTVDEEFCDAVEDQAPADEKAPPVAPASSPPVSPKIPIEYVQAERHILHPDPVESGPLAVVGVHASLSSPTAAVTPPAAEARPPTRPTTARSEASVPLEVSMAIPTGDTGSVLSEAVTSARIGPVDTMNPEPVLDPMTDSKPSPARAPAPGKASLAARTSKKTLRLTVSGFGIKRRPDRDNTTVAKVVRAPVPATRPTPSPQFSRLLEAPQGSGLKSLSLGELAEGLRATDRLAIVRLVKMGRVSQFHRLAQTVCAQLDAAGAEAAADFRRAMRRKGVSMPKPLQSPQERRAVSLATKVLSLEERREGRPRSAKGAATRARKQPKQIALASALTEPISPALERAWRDLYACLRADSTQAGPKSSRPARGGNSAQARAAASSSSLPLQKVTLGLEPIVEGAMPPTPIPRHISAMTLRQPILEPPAPHPSARDSSNDTSEIGDDDGGRASPLSTRVGEADIRGYIREASTAPQTKVPPVPAIVEAERLAQATAAAFQRAGYVGAPARPDSSRLRHEQSAELSLNLSLPSARPLTARSDLSSHRSGFDGAQPSSRRAAEPPAASPDAARADKELLAQEDPPPPARPTTAPARATRRNLRQVSDFRRPPHPHDPSTLRGASSYGHMVHRRRMSRQRRERKKKMAHEARRSAEAKGSARRTTARLFHDFSTANHKSWRPKLKVRKSMALSARGSGERRRVPTVKGRAPTSARLVRPRNKSGARTPRPVSAAGQPLISKSVLEQRVMMATIDHEALGQASTAQREAPSRGSRSARSAPRGSRDSATSGGSSGASYGLPTAHMGEFGARDGNAWLDTDIRALFEGRFLVFYEACQRFDGNKDGRVNFSEFRAAVEECGLKKLPLKLLQHLWISADVDAQGLVDFREFKWKWHGRKPFLYCNPDMDTVPAPGPVSARRASGRKATRGGEGLYMRAVEKHRRRIGKLVQLESLQQGQQQQSRRPSTARLSRSSRGSFDGGLGELAQRVAGGAVTWRDGDARSTARKPARYALA